MSQDLCRCLCVWRPACQDLAESFCLNPEGCTVANRAADFSLWWRALQTCIGERAVSRGRGPPRLALFGVMVLPTLNPNTPTVL